VTARDASHRERNGNCRPIPVENPWNLFAVRSWSECIDCLVCEDFVRWDWAMPCDGAIIFGNLIGKLDMLRVACAKCGRDGCYWLSGLIEARGRDAKVIDWLDELTSRIRRLLGLSASCATRAKRVPKIGRGHFRHCLLTTSFPTMPCASRSSNQQPSRSGWGQRVR
jgi:hypothetical protein